MTEESTNELWPTAEPDSPPAAPATHTAEPEAGPQSTPAVQLT